MSQSLRDSLLITYSRIREFGEFTMAIGSSTNSKAFKADQFSPHIGGKYSSPISPSRLPSGPDILASQQGGAIGEDVDYMIEPRGDGSRLKMTVTTNSSEPRVPYFLKVHRFGSSSALSQVRAAGPEFP
jgi:hypothetical protein